MYKIIGADGKEYGPIAAEQLRQWIIEGRANAQTRVLAEGATEWKALGEIPELAAMIAPPSFSAMPAPGPISIQPVAGPTGTNPLAVTGMVLGIVSVMFSCCCWGVPWNIAGIICSAIALSQIKSNPNQQGREMAIAGLILSILGIALAVVLGVLLSTGEILHRLQRNF